MMASNVLSKAFLPAATRSLLDYIIQSRAFSRFTLVGGSALAMRIGHRPSEDLDFIWNGEKLNSRYVDAALDVLRAKYKVEALLSAADLRRAKEVEGIDLFDYRRRYVVGDVKLELFVHHKPEIRRFIAGADKDVLDDSVNVLGLDGLFITKSVLVGERRRSRDLFDLMIMIREHGYSIDQLFQAVRKHDPIADIANHTATLRGTMAVDKDDEGLVSVRAPGSLEEIYGFFNRRIDDYEARLVAANVKAWRAEDKLEPDTSSG